MSKKLDNLGVSAFCESMAMMVQSGITTDEAIGLLQSGNAAADGILSAGLAVMKEKVDAGEGLSAAYFLQDLAVLRGDVEVHVLFDIMTVRIDKADEIFLFLIRSIRDRAEAADIGIAIFHIRLGDQLDIGSISLISFIGFPVEIRIIAVGLDPGGSPVPSPSHWQMPA